MLHATVFAPSGILARSRGLRIAARVAFPYSHSDLEPDRPIFGINGIFEPSPPVSSRCILFALRPPRGAQLRKERNRRPSVGLNLTNATCYVKSATQRRSTSRRSAGRWLLFRRNLAIPENDRDLVELTEQESTSAHTVGLTRSHCLDCCPPITSLSLRFLSAR